MAITVSSTYAKKEALLLLTMVREVTTLYIQKAINKESTTSATTIITVPEIYSIAESVCQS